MNLTIRVDEKMVKGQLTDQWTRNMKGDALLVIDDDTASNEIQSKVLSMTGPGSIRVVIKTLDAAMKILKDPRAVNMTIHVLVANLKYIDSILEEASPEYINITRYTKGRGDKKEICYGVKLTENDITKLKQYASVGIPVINQPIPDYSPTDLIELIG